MEFDYSEFSQSSLICILAGEDNKAIIIKITALLPLDEQDILFFKEQINLLEINNPILLELNLQKKHGIYEAKTTSLLDSLENNITFLIQEIENRVRDPESFPAQPLLIYTDSSVYTAFRNTFIMLPVKNRFWHPPLALSSDMSIEKDNLSAELLELISLPVIIKDISVSIQWSLLRLILGGAVILVLLVVLTLNLFNFLAWIISIFIFFIVQWFGKKQLTTIKEKIVIKDFFWQRLKLLSNNYYEYGKKYGLYK